MIVRNKSENQVWMFVFLQKIIPAFRNWLSENYEYSFSYALADMPAFAGMGPLFNGAKY
jgi:hypothetical protein